MTNNQNLMILILKMVFDANLEIEIKTYSSFIIAAR